MSEFLATLAFAFSITGPIFVVLGLGIFLTRIGLINDAFIETGSRLVFNVTLPALLFISISKTSFEASANLELILYGVGATLIIFVLLEFGLGRLIEPAQDRGVVVQGAFRSNVAIIGLAYCINAYGEAGLTTAALYLGLITILFNILAVITLRRSLHRDRGLGPTLKGIFTNPLIIGILLALPVAWAEVRLPEILLQAGHYFAQMTLPLALLCTGGSLSFHALRGARLNIGLAVGGKLLVVPALITLGGIWWGFRGVELGVLFLLSAAPTAAASYVMVRAMGGNAVLAANIIALTTLGSLLATSLGVTLLRAQGLM